MSTCNERNKHRLMYCTFYLKTHFKQILECRCRRIWSD